MASKIGEVLEASTGEFMAECYELHATPPLGSLVKTTDGAVPIYGIVSGAATGSIEPGRRPIARGKDETDEEDIYLKHPQLARLLRSTFSVLVAGHAEGASIRHYLPPRPARVHSFVYLCSDDEVREFTRSLDFLVILLNAPIANTDELIAACLRSASQTHEDSHAFLVGAGKQLALLLSVDMNRLNAILRRLKI